MWEKLTRRRTILLLVLIVLALAVSASAIAMVPEDDDNAADLPTEAAAQDPTAIASTTEVVVHQDATAAFEHDTALLATQAGMQIGEAEQIFSFQDAFAKFVEEVLLPKYESSILAFWPDIETATGHVRFIGEVPKEVVTEAANRGLDVEFTSNTVSMAENAIRSQLAEKALRDAGYDDFSLSLDQGRGVINIVLRVPNSEPAPTNADILQLIQDAITAYRPGPGAAALEGDAAKVIPGDFDITIYGGSLPVIVAITETPRQPTSKDGDSPIATWDITGIEAFHQVLGADGPLEFDNGCVLVTNSNGSKILPVWPEPTSWDPETETIHFVGPFKDSEFADAVLHEGDHIKIGGSAKPFEYPGYVFPRWAHEPTEGCLAQADGVFLVSGIVVEPAD